MKTWILMSDEGTTSCACDVGYGRTVVGSNCGTIVRLFSNEEVAKKALGDIEEASKKQRADYDVWSKRSYQEPYTSEFMEPAPERSNNEYVRMGAAMVTRTKARKNWMEKNPFPPTDLFNRFWLIECAVDGES